jgi:hypothetical protein
MIYFSIEEIKTEAINRSVLRSRHNSLLAIRDDDDVTDYLKIAADEIYSKLQTLVKDYEFDDKIAYRLSLPENFDKRLIAVIYTLAKDYLVEGILKGWFEDNGYLEGMDLSEAKQEKQSEKIQSYRIQRIGGVKKQYNGI